MPLADARGLSIAYESEGDGAPLLLLMGLGSQLIYWSDAFCAALAAQGLRVIRFDYRDVGLSSKIADAPPIRLRSLLARWLLGLDLTVPYTLVDLADDAAALLDALGIESAHVAGISMGGMVGQALALRHPARLRTLVSWSSHTGERRWFYSSPRAVAALLASTPRTREEAMARAVDFYRVVRSTGYPFDAELVRERAAQAYDRCFYPAGFARHVAAILASPARGRALRYVRIPTLVLHGLADPLIRPAAARATARAISGASLRLVEGLGHDLPEGAVDLLADAIVGHARAHDPSLAGRR